MISHPEVDVVHGDEECWECVYCAEMFSDVSTIKVKDKNKLKVKQNE